MSYTVFDAVEVRCPELGGTVLLAVVAVVLLERWTFGRRLRRALTTGPRIVEDGESAPR